MARQQYHIPGKIRDLHRLTHVQNENFAFVGVGPRLEHQGNSLRYRHEKSRDFRVGHRHRTACSDLLLEKGHDAAVAAQHVAETDCCEYGVIIFIVHGLHDHLAEALGCSHDVGRVHGFVGADEHEPADSCIPCRHGGFVSAEDIVLDCLVRGFLHKGHVLVGRCVVDDVRLIFRHHLPDASAVSDGADQGFQVKLGEVPPEFLLDVIDVVFVYIEDYEFSRSVRCHLSHQLAADGATAACDEDGFVRQVSADFLHIDADGFSTQEVFDGYVLKLVQGSFAVDYPGYSREDLELAAGFFADFEYCSAVLLAGGRQGDYDPVDAVFLHHFRDVPAGSCDGDAIYHSVGFVAVIVDEAACSGSSRFFHEDFSEEHFACFTCAYDHDVSDAVGSAAVDSGP